MSIDPALLEILACPSSHDPLRYDTAADELVCTVVDSGPGIPPELHGRLFELFATAKKGGTGLGLAIVKKIVDDHNGAIAAHTGTTGTSFVVKLPLQRDKDVD